MSKGSKHLLYYSVNTELAYNINQRFYGGKHYVWCSPIFDPKAAGRYSEFTFTGPTSSPHDIYCELMAHVKRKERHSAKIKENKIGIMRGATEQLKKKNINPTEFGYIKQIVDNAETADFLPYIYLIPADKISTGRIKKVMPADSATILGVEYKIEALRRTEFDIIEVKPW